MEDISDEKTVDEASENDVPGEVIIIDDSDTKSISVDTAALGGIEIDAWLDARKLPVEFSYHVGQKIKYSE